VRDELLAKAKQANEHYDKCLTELVKWQESDEGPLRDDDPEQMAAFIHGMKSTVNALDAVIASAIDARDANEAVTRASFSRFEASRKIRESHRRWDALLRDYRADREMIIMLTPSEGG